VISLDRVHAFVALIDHGKADEIDAEDCMELCDAAYEAYRLKRLIDDFVKGTIGEQALSPTNTPATQGED